MKGKFNRVPGGYALDWNDINAGDEVEILAIIDDDKSFHDKGYVIRVLADEEYHVVTIASSFITVIPEPSIPTLK